MINYSGWTHLDLRCASATPLKRRLTSGLVSSLVSGPVSGLISIGFLSRTDVNLATSPIAKA